MARYDLTRVPNADRTVTIPKEEYAQRVEKLRKRMLELHVDIAYGFATPCMPGDVFYLSGYDPQVENSLVLVSQEKLFVVAGPEGARYAQEMVKFGAVRVLSEMQIPLEDYPLIRIWSLDDVVQELTSGKVARVGVLTKGDVLTMDAQALMKKVMGPKVEFVDISDVLYYEMRYYKSRAEQAVLRVSNRICAEAVRAMCEAVEPGMTELEVTAYGDYVTKTMGAYGYSWDGFILSGPRINTCIGRGTNKKIQAGELVRIGYASKYEGYSSTAARSVVAGGATKEQAQFIDHSIRAHELAAAKYVYGGLERDVELAAWNYLEEHDLGKYQVYSVAHGTGISECLEARPFTKHSEGKIEKNITHMIDIGLYGHPRFHGASCEDPYLVTDDGKTERMSDLPLRMYRMK
jgi:Xaa-Pro aminopeptidase